MSRLRQSDKVRAEVAALEPLDHAALKARYIEITGEAPPKRIGRALLKLAVAYEIQRKPHRRYVESVHRKLEKVAESGISPNAVKKPKKQMKPGGRLVREWRGKTYEVYVADDGVYMEGKRFRSLSSAAYAITGAKWNGPRFFGLRSPRIESQEAS